MELLKKKIDIDKNLIMYFDMSSIAMLQAQGKSFIKSYNKLVNFDDEAVLDLVACTLRKKDNNEEPVGFGEVYENPMYYLINFGFAAVELVVESFPQGKNIKKKTKSQMT